MSATVGVVGLIVIAVVVALGVMKLMTLQFPDDKGN